MPFEVDDLRTLRDKAEAAIEAELPGTNARLRRSNLNVLARVQAMFTHAQLAFVREFLSQCLPWTMGFLLRQWASIWGIFPIAATYAQGAVVLSGVSGSVVQAGTVFKSRAELEYQTLVDATLAGGTATVAVIAILPGASGNLQAGEELVPTITLDGVSDLISVGVAGIAGGADDESSASLFRRFLQRVRNPAHGGNEEDYKGWAMEVPGVTRAWVYGGLDGLDTVQVYFVRDDDADLIPDAAAVQAVADHIRSPDRKPVSATVGVYAPVPKVVDFAIAAVPNTVAVRAAIEAELRDLFRREADLGGTIPLSHFHEAISLAPGEADHTMTQPAAAVVCAVNEIAVFGAITWN